MNHKYRKLPVEIEAFQMTKERRESNVDWPEWLHEAWNKSTSEPGSMYPADDQSLLIKTLEGEHSVTWDDWIIHGVQGELYPCKPDIFEVTYEEV